MVDRRRLLHAHHPGLATVLAVTAAVVLGGSGLAVSGPAWETSAGAPSGAQSLVVPPDSAAGAPAAFNPNGITITLQEVVSGLNQPVFVIGAGDRSGRLFVVEQGGLVKIVKNGSVLPTPFLDLSSQVSAGGERGLLGLAFHRQFVTNHKLYVNFTQANGATAINEYRVTTNPDQVSSGTGRRLLTIGQPYPNHNGGMLAFAPDGYLYIGMGDGGSSGDPQNRAQNLNSLLGKILRIDINGRTGARPYRIPSSNPYVGRFGLDQIWARGLRNPWRFSFDALTGDLWIGDVGQNAYEEIDRSLSPVRGRAWNFGWRLLEGRHCYLPATGCTSAGKAKPVVEYGHAEGCSVTGGYVYRGKAQPILQGGYFFADYCSGTIWTIAANAASPATKVALLDSGLNISSFGHDDANELYVVDHSGGKIYRIVGAAK